MKVFESVEMRYLLENAGGQPVDHPVVSRAFAAVPLDRMKGSLVDWDDGGFHEYDLVNQSARELMQLAPEHAQILVALGRFSAGVIVDWVALIDSFESVFVAGQPIYLFPVADSATGLEWDFAEYDGFFALRFRRRAASPGVQVR